MKIFAVRDAGDEGRKDLAYLFYYEICRQFYIELPEKADPWETPLLLSSFVERGEYTVDSHWSRIWVQQRIVPPDRQNIAQILRDNGLKSYDEFALLNLASGRCEHDDYYLVPIDEKALPNQIRRRFNRKVEDVVPLQYNYLLVFFRDGTIRVIDLNGYFERTEKFSVLLKRPELFSSVRIQTGGYGVQWDENLAIPDSELYRMGRRVPLTAEDFRAFASERIITTAEAAELLNCTRQNISDLVKAGQLHPVKSTGRSTLFLKSEVIQRSWR